jgi:hypothetical protein
MKLELPKLTPVDPPGSVYDEQIDWPVHEAAALFPPLSAEAYAALKQDIKTHGLREAVVVNPKGWILDGRTRARACQELDIEFETRIYDGDPIAFIVSANLHRRHLNEHERAEIAARIATLRRGGGAGGRPAKYKEKNNRPSGPLIKAQQNQASKKLPHTGMTIANAAKLMNVSSRSVRRAKARQRSTQISAAPPATKPAEPDDLRKLDAILRIAMNTYTIDQILQHVYRVLDVDPQRRGKRR